MNNVFFMMQAVEVLKLITGVGTTLEGRLMLYDGQDATTRVLRLRGKSDTCPLCKEEDPK